MFVVDGVMIGVLAGVMALGVVVAGIGIFVKNQIEESAAQEGDECEI